MQHKGIAGRELTRITLPVVEKVQFAEFFVPPMQPDIQAKLVRRVRLI